VTLFNPYLPTGKVGMAVSQDGLPFTWYKGHLSGGTILDPSLDSEVFDVVHLGVSDVMFNFYLEALQKTNSSVVVYRSSPTTTQESRTFWRFCIHMYHQGSQVNISYLNNECRRFFEVKNHY
jgi:hypothetical protein